MNKNEQTATMYESIPAVAELNKVPGFNPLKLLRRIISPENGEEMLQLDLRYKKLWFRLANPKGRIRLNALRITEQMAIYEAQVFLERTDENPIGVAAHLFWLQINLIDCHRINRYNDISIEKEKVPEHLFFCRDKCSGTIYKHGYYIKIRNRIQ